MAWKKASPEMGRLLEKALDGYDVDKRSMFGCPAWYSGNNWMGGVHEDNILIRLAEEDRREVLEKWPGARIFEPRPGRKMREFVILPRELLADAPQLDGWLRLSMAYTAALPPRKKKKRKK